jgi:hypothetical protein
MLRFYFDDLKANLNRIDSITYIEIYSLTFEYSSSLKTSAELPVKFYFLLF